MRRRHMCAFVVCGLLAGAVGVDAARPQILAGVQPNWKDLETWSHLDQTSRQTELGLGLQPIGGAVIAFLGQLSLSDPMHPPSSLRMHIAPAFMTNPNVLRSATLVFTIDPGSENREVIDLSSSLVADDMTAGGIIQNAIGPIRASDFLRLARAERLTANILGFDVAFRPDQIRAMQDFAERLHLPVPSR